MTKRPTTALRIQDLGTAIQFYHHGLGFQLDFQDHHAGVAQVAPSGEMPILLARHDAGDIASYMNETFGEAPKGKRLYFFAPQDLTTYRADLISRGIEAGDIQEKGDGRVLLMADPDGFLVSFWQAPHLTDDEVLERFERAPQILRQSLEGLSDEQLDLTRAPGKWTIRQTVHHMTDSAASSMVRILMALAESGRPFRTNPYSQDKWVASFDHAHRPVGTAVALLGAINEHVAVLVRHLENPLDRYVDTDLAGSVTVRRMLTMLGSHVGGHVEQIWETRKVHGI